MTRVRPATPTVAFIDQYCAHYRGLFHNVRHFEQFSALHLGLLAETRHKSLPRLGKTVHADPQALPHFLANAQWSVNDLRTKRLDLLRQALGTPPFIRCIDETGDGRSQEGAHDGLCRHPVDRQPAHAGQRRRLGQRLRRAGHHDVPIALAHLQARVPPQAG
jgi:SRSO17 transposase